MVPERAKVSVHGNEGDRTLAPDANGVVSELVDTDGSSRRLVPTG